MGNGQLPMLAELIELAELVELVAKARGRGHDDWHAARHMGHGSARKHTYCRDRCSTLLVHVGLSE